MRLADGWRWQLVAGRLRAPARLPTVVGAHYRSQSPKVVLLVEGRRG